MLNCRHFISLLFGPGFSGQRFFSLGLFALVLSGVLVATPVTASATERNAESFIEALAGDSFKIMSDASIARPERIARFRGILKNRFALDSIGKWALGRYWPKASSAERAEYLRLFEDMIIATYVDRLQAYANETLSVTRSIDHGDGKFTVYSKFTRPGDAKPITIDWRIGRKDGRFQIVDVVILGSSMSTTMRSEFASTIRRSNSGVTGLLEVMRAKTATLRLSAEK
ncbi:MAG: ABC transporter substrate-binding protein [Rhodospirillales bacterium]|nr:ABC transporter substrate-binding protein [Rhodospirillales bacterium]